MCSDGNQDHNETVGNPAQRCYHTYNGFSISCLISKHCIKSEGPAVQTFQLTWHSTFGHMQTYQARVCSEWEQLCSHISSPKLALLMVKMDLSKVDFVLEVAVLNQVSRSVH